VSVFSYPKEPHLRQQWLRAIHSANYEPGNSAVVCVNHFEERFIIREDTAIRDDGSLLVVPRKIPKLTKDAYPTIFPNQPSYFSCKAPAKRKSPEEREKEIETRNEENHKKLCQEDIIQDFEDFRGKVNKMNLDCFLKFDNENSVMFLKIDISFDIPKIVVSLKVTENCTILVSHNNTIIPSNKFRLFLRKDLVLVRWSKFQCLVI
jgi:hypothetical protein